jgi:hypothetical protein
VQQRGVIECALRRVGPGGLQVLGLGHRMEVGNVALVAAAQLDAERRRQNEAGQTGGRTHHHLRRDPATEIGADQHTVVALEAGDEISGASAYKAGSITSRLLRRSAPVVGVQAFDALAAHGGGAHVLPLETFFKGIPATPSAPEYWWIYALLLSTMIPSLVNFVIAGTSLFRGLPGLPSLLLRKIPGHGNVPKFDRAWIATVLTAQVGLGTALGIAAQALLGVVIIGYIMPLFGLELLDMVCDVAAFNLPARVGQLFGVSL